MKDKTEFNLRRDSCKFFSVINKCCVHKNNNNIESRIKSGSLRRYPKKCAKEFCPLLSKKEQEMI